MTLQAPSLLDFANANANMLGSSFPIIVAYLNPYTESSRRIAIPPGNTAIITMGAPPPWALSKLRAVGDQVVPLATPTGKYYRCVTGGLSSSTTEPTWPTEIGGTVADGDDGDVTWVCFGKTSDYPNPLPPLVWSFGYWVFGAASGPARQIILSTTPPVVSPILSLIYAPELPSGFATALKGLTFLSGVKAA